MYPLWLYGSLDFFCVCKYVLWLYERLHRTQFLWITLHQNQKGFQILKVSFPTWMYEKRVLHWLKGYLIWYLSLLFTSLIAILLSTNYPVSYLLMLGGYPNFYAHLWILSSWEGGCSHYYTDQHFHKKFFLHRLSTIITGLETKCLCTAGLFRNWIQIKFLANNSRQHTCVPFIFCHCSIQSPVFTKADFYFFHVDESFASHQHRRQLTARLASFLLISPSCSE